MQKRLIAFNSEHFHRTSTCISVPLPPLASVKSLQVFKQGCVGQCGSCRGLTRLAEGNVVNIFHPLADYKNGAWCCWLAWWEDGEQEEVVMRVRNHHSPGWWGDRAPSATWLVHQPVFPLKINIRIKKEKTAADLFRFSIHTLFLPSFLFLTLVSYFWDSLSFLFIPAP